MENDRQPQQQRESLRELELNDLNIKEFCLILKMFFFLKLRRYRVGSEKMVSVHPYF